MLFPKWACRVTVAMRRGHIKQYIQLSMQHSFLFFHNNKREKGGVNLWLDSEVQTGKNLVA